MSKKALLALVVLASLAACAPKTAPVDVTVEPVQTGKYK